MVPVERQVSGGRASGFTLVEIMIVVLIVGVIVGLAVPNFINAETNGYTNACISNLHLIESAKIQWGVDNNVPATGSPGSTDLLGTYPTGYIKNWPICPANGTYTIGNMATRPTCTVVNHVLP